MKPEAHDDIKSVFEKLVQTLNQNDAHTLLPQISSYLGNELFTQGLSSHNHLHAFSESGVLLECIGERFTKSIFIMERREQNNSSTPAKTYRHDFPFGITATDTNKTIAAKIGVTPVDSSLSSDELWEVYDFDTGKLIFVFDGSGTKLRFAALAPLSATDESPGGN